MSLVTRCPKCANSFLIEIEQLRAHDGLVRCGDCSNIFDGYAHLESKLPVLTRKVQVDEPAPAKAAIAQSTHYFDADAKDNEPSVFSSHPSRANNPFANVPSLDLAAEPAQDTAPSVLRHRHAGELAEPSFQVKPSGLPSVQGEARRRPAMSAYAGSPQSQNTFTRQAEDEEGGANVWLWGIGCLLALLLLFGQLAYVYRNDIATRLPIFRSGVETLCKKLGCEVSLLRQIDRITIEGTSLRASGVAPQEGQPAEYVVRLTMRNRLDRNQPWPHLLIELTDASSTVVVRKQLAPYQYLPSSLVDQPFAAQQEVTLALPIAVQGLQVNGFHIDKFFP